MAIKAPVMAHGCNREVRDVVSDQDDDDVEEGDQSDREKPPVLDGLRRVKGCPPAPGATAGLA